MSRHRIQPLTGSRAPLPTPLGGGHGPLPSAPKWSERAARSTAINVVALAATVLFRTAAAEGPIAVACQTAQPKDINWTLALQAERSEDYFRAADLMKPLVVSQVPAAQREMARIYDLQQDHLDNSATRQTQRQIEDLRALALELRTEAAAAGDPQAMAALEPYVLRHTQYPDWKVKAARLHASALACARQGAEQGVAADQHLLSQLLAAVDKETALQWLRQAALSGSAHAELDLGAAYERGVMGDDAVPLLDPDATLAVAWYERAAAQDLVDAWVRLAKLYASGRGLPRDPDAASGWWRKAAVAGDYLAQLRFADALATGDGVPKDTVEAVQWYGKVASLTTAAGAPYAVEAAAKRKQLLATLQPSTNITDAVLAAPGK